MLLLRDFVAHMANEVVKRLVEGGHIETKAAPAVANRVRLRMLEELTVEDRLNEEVRQILIDHQVEYQPKVIVKPNGYPLSDSPDGFYRVAMRQVNWGRCGSQ